MEQDLPGASPTEHRRVDRAGDLPAGGGDRRRGALQRLGEAVVGRRGGEISEGCLCPKGAATMQLVTGEHRERRVLYRRPGGTAWEPLPLATAMDMVAERVQRTRERTWQEALDDGKRVQRTLGIAHIGGATLDNEENYLLKKLYTALGVIQVENQARI